MEIMYKKIAQYINYMKQQGSSPNTAASYGRDLKKMASYLVAQGIEDCRLVSEAHLRAYQRHLEEEKKSPATVARSLAAIKAFFRFLVCQGEIVQNPAINIKAPRVEKRLPSILTKEEVVKLLKQPDGKSEKSIRDRAMLELLYATGIRVSELIQLQLADVNLSMDYLLCRQNGRERVIPIGKNAKQSLQVYLETARLALVTDPACGLLFTNLSGHQMSRQGFWKIIKQYGHDAGIQKEITPHTLRHSFAAHLVNNGADLFAVQEMMGYSGLSAAQAYAKMRGVSIRETYEKAHPRG